VALGKPSKQCWRVRSRKTVANFYTWLCDRQHEDAEVQALADFVKDQRDSWQSVLTEAAAQKNIAIDKTLTSDQRAKYADTVTRAWTLFSESPPSPDHPKSRRRWYHFLAENAPVLVITLLAVVLVVVLLGAVFKSDFLRSLAIVEVSRGLITFFFALGTVGVAIILVTAAFTSDSQELKERFDMGKQVLTALIGVFGTIVGFYFGTHESSGSGVGTVSVEDASVVEGDAGSTKLNFTIMRSGDSQNPKTYTYTFKDVGTDAKDFDHTDGEIVVSKGETSKSIEVLIKGDTESESDEAFLITVVDVDDPGNTASAIGMIQNDDEDPAGGNRSNPNREVETDQTGADNTATTTGPEQKAD